MKPDTTDFRKLAKEAAKDDDRFIGVYLIGFWLAVGLIGYGIWWLL
jgi:hypothetical protein